MAECEKTIRVAIISLACVLVSLILAVAVYNYRVTAKAFEFGYVEERGEYREGTIWVKPDGRGCDCEK